MKCFTSTGPSPPQNITAGSIRASQIIVHWMLPNTPCQTEGTVVVLCEDVSSRQERVVTNISRVSGTNRKQLYTAVIGGLESYRKYKVEVLAVTQFGVWSCRQEPLAVRTGEHVHSFMSQSGRIKMSRVSSGSILLSQRSL